MKQLRTRAIILTLWLLIFYMVTHIWVPLSINPVSYFYALAAIIFFFAVPGLSKINPVWLFLIPILFFICLKAILGLPWFGSALVVTIIECLAILVTLLILVWLRGSLQEFNNSVAYLSMGTKDKTLGQPIVDQNVLYREVRRARNHQRPLSILAIGVDETSVNLASDRIVKEAQQRLIKQLALTNISTILRDKLEDCDIVAQTNNHFLVILPETKPEDLPGLMDRLHAQIENQVGVDVRIGSASLPQDSYTMEGLLEKATLEMQGTPEPELFIEPERELIKNKTT
jgi:GGDEF domain-containing protein